MPQETVVLDALATVALSRLPSGPVSRPPLRAWLPLMNCSMSCMRRPEPLADATTHHSAPDGNLELDAFFNRPPSCGKLDAKSGPGRPDHVPEQGETARRVKERATHLSPPIDSPDRPGMDRRRFLLTAVAGALAAPLAAEGQQMV